MRHRFSLFLVFGVVITGLAEWNLSRGRDGFAAGLDRSWLEFCVANARDKISDPQVTLVTVDDDYKPAIGETLSQADYAAVFGFVGKFQPKAVAFEPNPVFDESQPINQTTLELLKEASLPLPRLTLGAVAENGQSPQNPAEEPKFPALTKIEGDTSQVTPLTRVVAAPNPQLLANGTPAFTGIELGGDVGQGSRTLPLIARQGDKVVASFIVHALASYAGVPLDQVSVKLPGHIEIGERYRIPIDSRGRMRYFEHAGIGGGFYPSISAFQLALTGDEDETIKKLLVDLEDEFESLKSNLVVIGRDRTEDRRETLIGYDHPLSKADVLTRAIAIIQSGRYIDWWPLWARLLSIAIIAALAAHIFRGGRGRAFGWGILGAFLWFGIAMVAFKSTLAWAPPLAPLLLFALILIIGLVLPEPKNATSPAAAAAE
ncbi:MAG: hypothetical protein KDM63_12920 [Verrucomicrobiae bacterium]|nr:hypothetical protein [Verrucomicrobiae bacterium]